MSERSTREGIAHARLNSQLLAEPAGSIADVARRLCAIQGQDYAHSLWAFGARLNGASMEAVEAAIADGTIVRTWPMRGTLHLALSIDVRWILELLAPEMVARHARRLREIGITDEMVERSQTLIRDALSGGRRITRPRLYALFDDAGFATREQGYHLLWRAAMDRVICIGPREGKQGTFVLFDDWVPPAPAISREEGLARLAGRYFVGHGPATISDFQWWSGLRVGDARKATAFAEGLESREIYGQTYWFAAGALDGGGTDRTIVLPAFDEYLVAYKDRSAVLAPELNRRINAGGGLLEATLVRNGRVVGTWKRKVAGKKTSVVVTPFEKVSATWKRRVEAAFRPWVDFHGLEPIISFQ
jgi:hypothetical protein